METFVVFDTETTGAYAIHDEVVEFGAVKWKNGQVLDQLQVLVKPTHEMNETVIRIHGITNEMVATAPPMAQEISKIRQFFEGAIAVAHHAPFDLGFLAWEFERYGQTLPTTPVLCTSLLSRQLIPESENHRLQTLVHFLGLPKNQAHRALEDALSCARVLDECIKRVQPRLDETLLESLLKKQRKKLEWELYSVFHATPLVHFLRDSILEKKDVQIVYAGGSRNGEPRWVSPQGLVRSPDGDYVVALCHIDRSVKRFYLEKISQFSAPS